jgi:hypothetical protein
MSAYHPPEGVHVQQGKSSTRPGQRERELAARRRYRTIPIARRREIVRTLGPAPGQLRLFVD